MFNIIEINFATALSVDNFRENTMKNFEKIKITWQNDFLRPLSFYLLYSQPIFVDNYIKISLWKYRESHSWYE